MRKVLVSLSKGEDGVGKVSISQFNSMIGTTNSTAALLTEGLANNFGKEGRPLMSGELRGRPPRLLPRTGRTLQQLRMTRENYRMSTREAATKCCPANLTPR
jgi:hypothetical protein